MVHTPNGVASSEEVDLNRTTVPKPGGLARGQEFNPSRVQLFFLVFVVLLLVSFWSCFFLVGCDKNQGKADEAMEVSFAD